MGPPKDPIQEFFFLLLMIMRMLGPWSSLVVWHWLIFSYLINQRVWMPSSWLIHWCRYEISYQWLIWYIFEKLVKWFFKLVNTALCYISDGFWQRIKKSWTMDLKWLFTQSFGSLCCQVWYFWNHAGSSSSWFRLILFFYSTLRDYSFKSFPCVDNSLSL